MSKIKIPTGYIEVELSSLTDEDVDKLLELYTEMSVLQRYFFQKSKGEIKEEMLKIIGYKIICENEKTRENSNSNAIA